MLSLSLPSLAGGESYQLGKERQHVSWQHASLVSHGLHSRTIHQLDRQMLPGHVPQHQVQSEAGLNICEQEADKQVLQGTQLPHHQYSILDELVSVSVENQNRVNHSVKLLT